MEKMPIVIGGGEKARLHGKKKVIAKRREDKDLARRALEPIDSSSSDASGKHSKQECCEHGAQSGCCAHAVSPSGCCAHAVWPNMCITILSIACS